MTLVSVIIPAYNAEGWIDRAIASVLKQSYAAIEIIIVNDGSTDETSQRCRTYGERLRLIEQSNQGVSAARNVGILASKGDWIAFLDADDEYLPDKVANLLRFAVSKGIKAATGNALMLVNDEVVSLHCKVSPKLSVVGNFFDLVRRGEIYLDSNTCLISREVFDQVGLFSINLKFGEDTEMWNRIGGNFLWGYLHENVSIYRKSTQSSVTLNCSYEYWADQVIDCFYTPAQAGLYIRPELIGCYFRSTRRSVGSIMRNGGFRVGNKILVGKCVERLPFRGSLFSLIHRVVAWLPASVWPFIVKYIPSAKGR